MKLSCMACAANRLPFTPMQTHKLSDAQCACAQVPWRPQLPHCQPWCEKLSNKICIGNCNVRPQAPTAIRAAANCYCQLLVTHSDTNVKMIVLDRLHSLMKDHADVLSEMLMDVMRALATPAFEIRRKILDLAMDLITPKNINEVRAVAQSW